MDLSKNSFSSRMGSGIYESETQRLQREADNFTKKLEHERKRFMILEDQLKQAQSEFDEKKISLKKVRPPTAQQKKDVHKIKLLENQLEKVSVKYNDTVSTNKVLRSEVDALRKEHKNAFKVTNVLKKEIRKCKDNAVKMSTTTNSGKNHAEEMNNKILALKAKHEAEKQNFEHKI